MAFPEHITGAFELNLPRPKPWADEGPPAKPRTPSEWFADKFPAQVKQYGCPFLEMRQSSFDGFNLITPVSINVDFFAAMLGGDKRLGESVVYDVAAMEFYYLEPFQQLYKPTTPDKLQNYYRSMVLRCAQELGNDTAKIGLFTEFRSDKVAKDVVNRAKSVLAADQSFFSATSHHQRIKGPELHERLMSKLVETMLEPKEGACLTVTEAYELFCRLSQERGLGLVKRSIFRESMRDLVRDKFGMALRHDVPDEQNRHQQAWKGLKVVEAGVLAA